MSIFRKKFLNVFDICSQFEFLVAYDGVVAVAQMENNAILIWNYCATRRHCPMPLETKL